MDFQKKLEYAANKNKSFVCVGLDSNLDLIPSFINKGKLPQAVFNKKIVDATADLVCAYKPNAAFYEQNGSDGIAALKSTCDYIRKRYPEIPIILDAKRADIDSTNNGYAEFAFGYLKVDAITIHPYLGRESVESFLKYREKGIFVLCRTSNQGAGEFQDLIINKKPLYQIVAENVAKRWNKNNNCMLVVGATYPDELRAVRKIVKDMILLIPGIGAQGGDLKKTIYSGLNSKKKGMIISSSRSIIFASKNKDFAEKARLETKKLAEAINALI